MTAGPALAALLCSAALRAQDDNPFAMPRDARTFLAWHLAADPATDDWEELSSRLYRYYQSGAYPEAKAVAERMASIDPGNPDLERFRIYLRYRADGELDEPLAQAVRWMDDMAPLGAPGQAMHGQMEEMERFRRELLAERARRADVAAAGRRALWLPLAALGLCALCAWHVARSTRGR